MNCTDQTDFTCDCCSNELSLDRLCSKKIKACKIWVNDLEMQNALCAPVLSSPSVCTGSLITKTADISTACVTQLNATTECVQNLMATTIGTSTLVANPACVPGKLQVGNLLNCGVYRAAAVFSTLTTYTLGTNINFDTVLDDPNNNVTTSPTAYTVSVSGYYMISFKFNLENFVPATSFGPVLGTPAANLQVIVNGSVYGEEFNSFIPFLTLQKSVLTVIAQLNVGDIVQFVLNIAALNQASGFVLVPGTVQSTGNATDVNQSGFKIHLLSVNCATPPCQASVPCVACTAQTCVPCTPASSTMSGSSSSK